MKISVALCTFNGEKYLEEQLKSIINQSVKVDEIVIGDDQSTDTTVEILKNYQKNYPDLIRLIFNEKNVGYIKNFENVINHCNGDLIFLSDQDDIWFPEKVEKIQNTFKNNNNISVISHNLQILLKDNKIHQDFFWTQLKFDVNSSNEEIIRTVLLNGNIFPGMSLAITKEATKYLPFYNLNKFLVHDFQLVINSCNEKKFLVLNDVLAIYRLHESQNIGFDLSKKPNNDINELFIRKNNRNEFVEILKLFNLNSKFLQDYDFKTQEIFNQLLKKHRFIERILLYVKLRFYYKLLQ